jgi:hypothetical protein
MAAQRSGGGDRKNVVREAALAEEGDGSTGGTWGHAVEREQVMAELQAWQPWWACARATVALAMGGSGVSVSEGADEWGARGARPPLWSSRGVVGRQGHTASMHDISPSTRRAANGARWALYWASYGPNLDIGKKRNLLTSSCSTFLI